MKTNKSFSKRLKVTKNGKVIGRKPGKNHFNARARRVTQLNGKRGIPFVVIKKKELSSYIALP